MTTKPLDRLMFAQGGLCFFCKEPLPQSEAGVKHLVASANDADPDADEYWRLLEPALDTAHFVVGARGVGARNRGG